MWIFTEKSFLWGNIHWQGHRSIEKWPKFNQAVLAYSKKKGNIFSKNIDEKHGKWTTESQTIYRFVAGNP